jgi:hypothetical protein
MFGDLFYRSNPLLVCLALLGLLLAAREVGFMSARRGGPAPPAKEDRDLPIVLSSVLTLLSLMLAFTYSVSQGSFEKRRQLVIDEANVIKTVYLRAATLPHPMSDEIRDLCRQYAGLRMESSAIKKDSPEKIGEFDVQSGRLQDLMWSRVASLAADSPSATVSLFLQGLNELIDLHNKRLAAFRYRVPFSIYLVLFVISAVAVGLTGRHFGAHHQRRDVLTLIFAILVALTMWLILDLDSPVHGTIRVNQQSFIDLQQEIGPPRVDGQKRLN